MKEVIYKLDFIKIKNFFPAKDKENENMSYRMVENILQKTHLIKD